MPVIITGMSKRLIKRTRKLAPVRPDKTVQRQARSELDALIDPMVREVMEMAPFLTTGTMGNAALQLGMLLDKWQRIFGKSNAGIAWKWVQAADAAAKDRLQRSLGKALGVDQAWILDPPEMAQSFEGLLGEAQGLISTVPVDYIGRVGEALLKSFRQERLPESRSIISEIEELGKITHERAKVIARDQTSKYNSAVNQIRQTDLGIKEYIWRTSGDSRVVGDPGGKYPEGNKMHMNHYVRNGKRYKWTEPPPDGHPGWPIQCLPLNSRVAFPNACNKLWRGSYNGGMVTIVTASGGHLEATANHPILTGRGWVAVQHLQEGDYIVKTSGKCNLTRKMYDDKVSPRLIDIWEAFEQAQGTARCSAEFNFHGDIVRGEVDVIDVDLLLRSNGNAGLAQLCHKFGFSGAESRATQSPLLADLSGANEACSALFFAFCSLVGGFAQPFAFNSIGLAHTGVHGFTSVAHSGTVLLDYAGDNISGYAVGLSERLHRLASGIATQNGIFRKRGDHIMRDVALGIGVREFRGHDGLLYEFEKIDSVSVRDYSGPVVNVQTQQGYYIADGVVNHNCRCTAEPVLELDNLNVV